MVFVIWQTVNAFIKFPVCVSVHRPGHGSVNYSARDVCVPATLTKLLISVREGNHMCFGKTTDLGHRLKSVVCIDKHPIT